MGALLGFLLGLFLSGPAQQPKQKSHRPYRPALYCSNTMLHHRPKRLQRVYYWNHRPMCRSCYQHYCRNIRVTRWFR